MIDGALIGQQTSYLVADGGGIVSLRSSYKIDDPRLRVHNVLVIAGMQETATLKRIADLIGNGGLQPRVAEDGRYSYRDAVAAHLAAEAGGKRGRIVLIFSD
jgi:NADPH:quinone reductase-like Zn-dependent oxidoreductase